YALNPVGRNNHQLLVRLANLGKIDGVRDELSEGTIRDEAAEVEKIGPPLQQGPLARHKFDTSLQEVPDNGGAIRSEFADRLKWIWNIRKRIKGTQASDPEGPIGLL